ncbi:MAG: hypothetical protein LBP43_02390 [Treponema sp.]|jgi:hypothetical protein|nr:hypothetical protein [Treponema sp.]
MMSLSGVRRCWFIYITGIFFLFPSLLGALEVDTDELAKNQAPVFFLNYEGPHARIETLEQIRAIGYSLGSAVNSGSERPGQGNRYFVIHVVSGAEGNKLDADIFGLGVDVGVDHIRNLRLIIQGYLEGAYAYSPRDAALLAEYATIYNAIYRKNWDYFGSRYKTPVMANLSQDRVGISIRFDEWPGQTLMVIPLRLGVSGSLSAVDTTSLGDSRVIDEMRRDPDRNIDQRKEMVDLKEREAAEAEQRAALQREAIAGEEDRIARERVELEAEQNAIARERQQAREDEAAGRTDPEETRSTNNELDAREAAVAEKEEELRDREEDLEDQRAEVQRTEEFAEQKIAEAQEEREDIARDQQEIITGEREQDDRTNAGANQNAEGPSPQTAGLIGMRMIAPTSPLGQLVRINPASGEVIMGSTLNTVNARTLTFLGDKIIAVAGEDRGNGAIRLVEINPETLEMNKQGAEDIHRESLLWVNGNEFYVITSAGENLYLGRFNTNLDRQALSSVPVHPYATVNFQGDLVFTQRADGSALILNARDLSERN